MCSVALGTSKFIRDRQIFIEHRARAYSTLVLVGTDRLEPRPKPRTTLLSPKGQVWAKLQLRHCTAILHCEYTQPRIFSVSFFTRKLNTWVFFVAHSYSRICSVGYLVCEFVCVFMSHDGEYVTYVSARIACYINISPRRITLTKIVSFKISSCEMCYKIILL